MLDIIRQVIGHATPTPVAGGGYYMNSAGQWLSVNGPSADPSFGLLLIVLAVVLMGAFVVLRPREE